MKPTYAAFVSPVDLDGPEPRRFTGVAYSGGLASPAYWGPSVVDLSSTTIAPPLPLLFRHDHDKLSIGLVTAATNDGLQIVNEGVLHTDLDDAGGALARAIAARAKKGEPWQQSLGLYDFSEEKVPSQKVVEVNGRSFRGPLTVMRGGTVREITFAPLGADPNTTAAVYAAASEVHKMPEVDTTVAALSAELDELRKRCVDLDGQVAALKAERSAMQSRLAEMRAGEVRALFTECGMAFDDSTAKPYLEMSDEMFKGVAGNLRAVHGAKPTADAALFQHVATGDEPPANLKFEPRKPKPVSALYAHIPPFAQKEA